MLEKIGEGEVPVRNCPLLEGLLDILERALMSDAIIGSHRLNFFVAYETGHGEEGSAREIRE